MIYFELTEAKKKVNASKKAKSHLLISAPSGYGKTALVKYYYKKDALYLTVVNGELLSMPQIENITEKIIVIDDLSLIEDADSRLYIKSLFNEPGFLIILVSRTDSPNWLADKLMEHDFVRIGEKDLTFNKKQIEKILSENNLTSGQINKIAELSKGYPLWIKVLMQKLESKEEFSDELLPKIWDGIFTYYEGRIYSNLSELQTRIYMALCPYDEFNFELAQAIIEDLKENDIKTCILDGINKGILITGTALGKYKFFEPIKNFMLSKRQFDLDKKTVNDQYERAAMYYKKHNELPLALYYYNLTDNMPKMVEILMEHASNNNIGIGQYYELRKYYMSIPEEYLDNSPALISTLSLIYSALLMPEKSEELYTRLCEFERDKSRDLSLRKEAGIRIVWLDISLPHRCAKGIIGNIKKASSLVLKEGIKLPEFSATSNMPSLMNGSLDFSEWSKIDENLAKFMAKPVEVMLKESGRGLVNIALAESGFEKGSLESKVVKQKATDGYMKAATNGTNQMAFVGMCLVAKQHIIDGNLNLAINTVKDFEKILSPADDVMLHKNFSAFKTSVNLYAGGDAIPNDYMEKILPQAQTLYVLNRYLHIVKLKCLISLNRLQEALDLSYKLESYFENYGRTLFWIENRIYRSIVLYRLGDSSYENILVSALKKAQEYHFVRTFSLIGKALEELLSKFTLPKDIDKEFFDQIVKETQKVAVFYPQYLGYEKIQFCELTPQEESILSLLCQGKSLNEISDICNIKYNTVRVHAHNIYQKLGVTSRSEAEHLALEVGLVDII